ncbi:hypothetical protein A0H81_00461 [Grifola frondosa]|uniref:B-block binding subunit of TFIIIC domain-containing protein n=1 Tax=Grifola frondosa TaxID=5627 RepID=A0A1C7MXT8_GRIFR|nr:hypothetical protein A0H81_00461 [Grifola frondosa]
MDELIRHCLRELSFDGDLGCDVSRLRDFIAGFYERSPCAPSQNVDAAFCAFVWAVVVQQPGVSAARKARAKGEEPAEGPAPATTLDVVQDATIRPLEELKAQYGEGLRIAVDPETTFAAITGRIFGRRKKGISVVDLGKKSGYDQKTCFYVIKQLVELDLVVKRRRPGISTNLCVHKYFFEHSPVWRQVVEEEARAQAEDAGGADEDEQGEAKALPHVGFDPIDARHLSSMPLLRARVVKLLRNSPHHMHTSQNLLIKIGFANPTRTDRRFFRTRLRELMEQGVIEKVQVPHADRKRFPERKVPCIRLLTEDATPSPSTKQSPWRMPTPTLMPKQSRILRKTTTG